MKKKKNRSRSPFKAIIPSLSSQNLLNDCIKESPCIRKQSTFAVHVSEADTRECILDAVNNQNKSQILIVGKI